MNTLAIDGGKPVRSEPMAPWPFYAEDEIKAVEEVMRSGRVNYWTGPFGRKFEEEFAAFHGMKYGIALANGTLALELALIGLKIGPGDEVITTCRTFIASASCIVRVGAKPIIVDIDPDTQNMSVQAIEAAITPKTKAIIAVHLAGWPCDMEAIQRVASKYKVDVIEDCAQAHGSKIAGKRIGSFGIMSAFSFCQDKIMSTLGEGGMLLLNDKEMYERLWAFKDHGKSYDAVFKRQHPPGFRWLHESFGTNWRLTEAQSVVGLKQLEKLDQWIEKRRDLSHTILHGLKNIKGLRIPVPTNNEYHSYYKFYAFVVPEMLSPGWDRDKVMAAINAEGLTCLSGSCGEIYLEKAFTNASLGPAKRFDTAMKLGATSLMFLVHPTLDQKYADELVAAVKKVMQAATQD